ncbi:hypothetical protein HY419_01400, partial [candidate division WWE3 bacterium]|nr:hypothetical protein [candidate division WWE3 bacterium]
MSGDTTPFVIDEAGDVGLGTTTPNAKLEVIGDAVIGTGGTGTVFIGGTSASGVSRVELTVDNALTSYFTGEAQPRIQLNRDLIGSGLAGLAFGPGASTTIAAGGSAIGYPAASSIALYTSDGAALTERLRIDGSGLFKFEKGTNDLTLSVTAPTGASRTLTIPALTADADICHTGGNCSGAGSGVTQSGSNALGQIAYFTAANDITSAANFTITPAATTGSLLSLSSSASLSGTLTGQSIDLSGTTATGFSTVGLSVVANPTTTNVGSGTYSYKGLSITGSALSQTTAGGTDTWTGADITIPALTANHASATVTGNGLKITGGNITQTAGALTENALNIDISASDITTGGTLNGISIAG